MGLKWFPWGSFCPSTSNRPELQQFRTFFYGNVWIHLPCFQHSGIELLSLKGLKFLFSELHGTFQEIFGTLDGFPKGIGSLGWVWNGFHGVHSALQHPIGQNYNNLDLSLGEGFNSPTLFPAFWHWTCFFERIDFFIFWTSWHFLSNIWHPRWVSKRDWVTWMGLKWFPWGSFCPSTSNRLELHQFRPFFWGNVWIHLPCFQHSGIELFSLKGLKFLSSELHGTF